MKEGILQKIKREYYLKSGKNENYFIDFILLLMYHWQKFNEAMWENIEANQTAPMGEIKQGKDDNVDGDDSGSNIVYKDSGDDDKVSEGGDKKMAK